MKFCSKCGFEMTDDTVNCARCGCSVDSEVASEYQPPVAKQSSGGVTVTKAFMIIGTVFMALYTFLIGLAWCLPMTIHYFNSIKRGVKIGTGFKICTLLFVNTIAGILMLCDNSH